VNRACLASTAIVAVTLSFASLAPSIAHALPPDFDGERGIEVGITAGYGLYTHTNERLFWTQNESVIAGTPPPAITSGGADLRFHLGYRFTPILSAGVYGELQWIGAAQTTGTTTTAFSGGTGVYARFYPAALFNGTLDARRVRFDGVMARRRLDPFVSLGVEVYQSITRNRADTAMSQYYANWNRHSVGIPLVVGVEVRLIPALAMGIQIGWTPLIGGSIDKTVQANIGGNVVTTSTQYESVDVFNSQFWVGVSARYTLTLF
jgi:hypothetical protein